MLFFLKKREEALIPASSRTCRIVESERRVSKAYVRISAVAVNSC